MGSVDGGGVVMVYYDMVWYTMIWYDMVWYTMVWYGMVWYGILETLERRRGGMLMKRMKRM
jgi:hypothetical protein